MRLTTFVTLIACYATCMVLLCGPANGRIPSIKTTARKFSNTFLKIAGARGPSGARGARRRSSPAGAVDLIFVLDRSGSVGRKNFDRSLKFIEEVLNYWSVSPSTTRVAAISYSTSVRTEFLFNAHVNRECVVRAVKRIKYTGGLTATAPSLQRARSLYQSSSSGARPSAKKVVFFLTDGKSNRGGNPSTRAAQLRNIGAQIFVLGIGHSVRESELNNIASKDKGSPLVFRVRNFADLRNLMNAVKLKNRVECTGSGTRYDECGRRCRCSGGKLVNCCRVRKDFPSMSTTEKERYIRAVKIVSTQQPYKARYDALVKIHIDNFNLGIHRQDQFLPWHRWYLLQFENILREVDCRITMPYWDWSLWSHDPWGASSVWSAIGNRGFGGNGNPSQGRCVTTGPFRRPGWSITTGACLQRRFNGNTPDAVAVQNCLNINNFNDFEGTLNFVLHNSVHVQIGGTMSGGNSANAPEFQLHHGFVDKIWADWQKKSSTNLNAHFPGINSRMSATPYYPRDLIDLRRQPGCVRVCYDDPKANNGRRVKSFLRRLSPSQLRRIPRRPFSRLSNAANRLFRLSKSEIRRARVLEARIRRGIVSSRSKKVSFRSRLDRILGFKLITPPRIAIRPRGPVGPIGRPRPPARRSGGPGPPAPRFADAESNDEKEAFREDMNDDEKDLLPEQNNDAEAANDNDLTAQGEESDEQKDDQRDVEKEDDKQEQDNDEEETESENDDNKNDDNKTDADDDTDDNETDADNDDELPEEGVEKENEDEKEDDAYVEDVQNEEK